MVQEIEQDAEVSTKLDFRAITIVTSETFE